MEKNKKTASSNSKPHNCNTTLCCARQNKNIKESTQCAGSIWEEGCPKVIYPKWPSIWIMHKRHTIAEKNFNSFTSSYTNYPKRWDITKKLYWTRRFQSNINHNKLADSSKYDSHLSLQFNWCWKALRGKNRAAEKVFEKKKKNSVSKFINATSLWLKRVF